MTLVETLRAFAQAYPLDVFPPITDEERERLGAGLISRASAGMARHIGSFFTDAADRIEELEAIAELASRIDILWDQDGDGMDDFEFHETLEALRVALRPWRTTRAAAFSSEVKP